MLRKLVDRGLMSPPLYALSAISSINKIFHTFINVNNTKAKDLQTGGEQQIQKIIENNSLHISKMKVQVNDEKILLFILSDSFTSCSSSVNETVSTIEGHQL